MARWLMTALGLVALLAPVPAARLASAGAAHAAGMAAAYGAIERIPGRHAQPPSRLLGPRSKSSGCLVRGRYPDPACTPGAVFPNITAAQICVPGYSDRVRDVSLSTWRRVYSEYGIASHRPYSFEVDHLVSLELGGSNSIANLWPEAATPKPGYRQKDVVENYLHRQVCSGAISLAAAQRTIATRWLKVYRRISR